MKNKLKFIIWKDKRGEFRWKARRSGRVVAEGGEGYNRKAKLEKTLGNFLASIGKLDYKVEEEYEAPSKESAI